MMQFLTDPRTLVAMAYVGYFALGGGLTALVLLVFAWPRYVRRHIDAYTKGELARLKGIVAAQTQTIGQQAVKIEKLEGIRQGVLSVAGGGV
jgi:hypothetical protein